MNQMYDIKPDLPRKASRKPSRLFYKNYVHAARCK